MHLANFNPIILRSLLGCVLYTAALILFCLMARRAVKFRRLALHWILPMLVGFCLLLFSGLANLLALAQWQATARGVFRPFAYYNFILFLYPVAFACLVYGAFRQWLLMRQEDGGDKTSSMSSAPATPQESVWPPPPKQ